MPMYEYQCKTCKERFELFQSIHTDPEETACPHCKAKKATRLLSRFASKIVGDHKTGFAEMKAYDDLNQRMDTFGKLPPLFGKRALPTPSETSPSDASPQGGGGSDGA